MKEKVVNKQTDLTSALIIGGKSSRFGSLKQLAEFEQRKLIDYSIQLAEKLTERIIAITGPHRFNLPESIPQYNDLVLGKGPIGGILTALHYADSSFCIMIPCDMPLLNAGIYHALIDHLPSDVPVVAQSHRGIEPLVSIWPKSLYQKVDETIRANKLKLYLFLQEMNAKIVLLERKMKNYNPIYFTNINTREDLETLRRYHEKGII